jgi:hypothetical protein
MAWDKIARNAKSAKDCQDLDAKDFGRELARINTNKKPFVADCADERSPGTTGFTAKGVKERKGDQDQGKFETARRRS